ncbi:YjdJ family protein [Bacillus sp. FJAT-49736]|uniref:YjdJ family protein n=1 Tax=Bacillus sp. FJAT-49736 TaxID=2833582 RepID=UPI001BC94B33|nr:YjdJ family protein [Bacillus sp. FJAT-49736]MBS4174465.1 YjdJ family protein [Bacillus sp. FJAT-49736]MBS4175822.1 YjdJ family protein [Bacillus sp. FJAT-49736]
MFRRIIQFGVPSIFLFFSTAVAWYEGSELIDIPWEWKYSTPFTQLLYGQVNNPCDISQLDYFIYAAKFHPTFPIMMVLSSLFLLTLIGYYSLKQQKKLFTYFLSILGGGLFLFSYFTFHSPTVGGHLLFLLFFIYGLLCITTALILHLQISNQIMIK